MSPATRQRATTIARFRRPLSQLIIGMAPELLYRLSIGIPHDAQEHRLVEDLELDLTKLTESGLRVVTRAEDEARRRGQELLTSEHLFIAFAQVEWALLRARHARPAVNPDDVLDRGRSGARVACPQLAADRCAPPS